MGPHASRRQRGVFTRPPRHTPNSLPSLHSTTRMHRMPPLGDTKACQAPQSLARTTAPRITASTMTSSRAFAEHKSAEEPSPVSPTRGRAGSLGAFPPSSSSSSSSSSLPTSTSNSTTTTSPLSSWCLTPSRQAERTSNPVRNIVDHLKPNPTHPLPCLNFALGDPTSYASQGHLLCPDVLVEAVTKHAREGLHNGYTCSAGALDARQALAAAFSHEGEGCKRLTAEDVIIASGGSGALEIVMTALLNEGDVVLIPRPGFALYQVIAQSLGAVALPYELLPEQNWAIDLPALEATIVEYNSSSNNNNSSSSSSSSRGAIKAILINNPSNPCGNILSKPNLLALLDLARRHYLPIISDEIYGQVCFPGEVFYPLGALTKDVPVLTVGGLAKQFAVPGWRVGWVLIHDPLGLLDVVAEGGKEGGGVSVSVRQGLKNLTQLILGANTLAQSVIPTLFPPTPSPSLEVFHTNYVQLLAENARFVQATLLPAAGAGNEGGREGRSWGCPCPTFPKGRCTCS